MKARILSFLPSLNAEQGIAETFQLARIQIGLSEPRIIGIEKDRFEVGEEIDLSHHVLERDADGILISVARELYEHGRSNCAVVEDDDLGARSDPTDYSPNDQCSDVQAAYLKQLWHMMKAAGRFDLRAGFTYFVLDFPNDEIGLYRIFELGHLSAEYEWKIKHEKAALAEYDARTKRTAGLIAASAARKLKGRETKNIVWSYATDALTREPNRSWTNTSLAEEVLRSANQVAERNNDDCELEIDVQRIRKIIGELRASKRLEFP